MKCSIVTLLFLLLSQAAVQAAPAPKTLVWAWIELVQGTPVTLRLEQVLHADELVAGQFVPCKSYNQVKYGNKILIEHGVEGTLKVSEVIRPTRRKKGSISLVAESVVAIDGQRIALRSVPVTLKSEESTGTIIRALVLDNVRIKD